MKIRTRLIFLNGISVLFSLGTVLAYFLIMGSLSVLESEQQTFFRVLMATQKVEVETSKLSTEILSDQQKVILKTREEFLAALDAVSKVSAIKNINETMAQSIKALAALGVLANDSFASLDTSVEDLIADAEIVYGSREAGTVFSIYNQARVDGSEELDQIAFHIATFQNLLSSQHTTMEGISHTLSEKDSIIRGEIQNIRNRTTLFSLLVVVLLMGGLVLVSSLVSRTITRSLRDIEDRMEIMSKGDLSGRFVYAGKDEIARVGQNLNGLLSMLHASLGKTQKIARQNAETKELLLSTVNDASSSVVQIDANTESIARQMGGMDDMIQGSGDEIGKVAQGTGAFAERIQKRERQVADSVASVTEMLASIENITRIAAQDQKAAMGLVEEAETGRRVFEDSFDQVGRIADQVDLIQEMASVIANIASQTNILSMNAAIEAAHAGDAGKGFAVVADEISKLATASAESSIEISGSIKTIIDQVSSAVSTRQVTTQTFDNISSRIRTVADSMSEIYQGIGEIQAGSQQILEAMQGLREDSGYLSSEAGKIDEATRKLSMSFAQVTRVSSEVASSIGEISSGLRLISTSVQDVRQSASHIGELGQDLEESVKVFTLGSIEVDKVDKV